MFKSIVKVSIVLSSIFFIGCGGSSSVEEVLPTVSKEVKSLAESLAFKEEVSNQVAQSKKIGESKISRGLKQSRQEFTTSCTNGGTMTFIDDFDPTAFDNLDNFDMNDFNMSMTMSFDNCVEDGMIANGRIDTYTQVKNQLAIMTMKYITDFRVDDGVDSFTILKDSTIKNEMVSETKSISTETITVLFGDERYEAKNLKMAILMDNNSDGFYPISGEEIINGKSFIVDESYDASKTPMILDSNGDIKKGGKSKYIDSENNHITIEATSKNEITVSVDKDGDGKTDEQEVIKI